MQTINDIKKEQEKIKNLQYLYRHFDKDGNLLYVGISLSVIQRLSQHKNCSPWYHKIAKIEVETFDDRASALVAEKKAIIEEHPIYNKYRPKPEYLEKKTKAQNSRDALTKQIVEFKPTYTVQEAAHLLHVSILQIKEWVDSGQMGAIITSKHFDKRLQTESKKRMITGWQMIDFLENWEYGNCSTKSVGGI